MREEVGALSTGHPSIAVASLVRGPSPRERAGVRVGSLDAFSKQADSAIGTL